MTTEELELTTEELELTTEELELDRIKENFFSKAARLEFMEIQKEYRKIRLLKGDNNG